MAASYHAPLKDMHFVLNELAGLEEILSLPGYEEVTPDVVGSILDEAARFARDILAPLNAIGDRQGCELKNGTVRTPEGFREAYRQFVASGWPSLLHTGEFGGQGLPYLVAKPVQEMWKSANLAFSLCPMLTQGAVEALLAYGTEDQKRTFLPKLVSGEWSATMNLTEPQAGSDLSAVQTRATPEGDHYRLRGVKIFITWGDHDLADNIVHFVLARLPDAPEGVKGISMFLVPKCLVNPDGSLRSRNDLQCVSLERKLGIHASPTAVMALGDREGAWGWMVGEPNRGLECMFTMMNHARLAVGLEGVAVSERAFQQARSYARERIQGKLIGDEEGERVSIIRHPDVRRMLMSMKAQTEAMRALTYCVASFMDKAMRHPVADVRKRNQALLDLLTPVVKGWCTEQAVEIASTGIQIHGGIGYIEEVGASQYLRDARITPIYEGTTGIQANDLIGRKMVRDGGMAIRLLMDEIRQIQRQLFSVSGIDFTSLAASMTAASEALAESTGWMLGCAIAKPKAAAAVSVPYLKLVGVVAGGWQMARAALIARNHLSQGSEDTPFYQAKLITARFYAEHVLPLSSAYRHMVVNGSSSVLTLDETQL